MNDREYRFVEFRADGDALTGIVVRYGDRARIGRFTESFKPGAIEFSDVTVNIQHDRRQLIARTDAGLDLDHSARQLRAVISLPDTSHGRDAGEMIKRGLLRGLSAEFTIPKGGARWSGNHRTIHRAVLHGIGLVDKPAYPDSVLERAMGAPEPGKVIVPTWL